MSHYTVCLCPLGEGTSPHPLNLCFTPFKGSLLLPLLQSNSTHRGPYEGEGQRKSGLMYAYPLLVPIFLQGPIHQRRYCLFHQMHLSPLTKTCRRASKNDFPLLGFYVDIHFPKIFQIKLWSL